MFKTNKKSQERIRQISLSRFQRKKVGRKSYHELKNSLFLEKTNGLKLKLLNKNRKYTSCIRIPISKVTSNISKCN